jgi:hypothetical protein
MSEIDRRPSLRFRCQVGHSYTAVGSHLGLRISNFESEKPLNLRISTFNILTFNGFPSRLELRDELSRIGARMHFALAGSSHLEPR